MKTSKLLLLTIIGLIFCIMDVTFDKNGQDSISPTEHFCKVVKACHQKYFSDSSATLSTIKSDFINHTYKEGINNYSDLELTAMEFRTTSMNDIDPW